MIIQNELFVITDHLGVVNNLKKLNNSKGPMRLKSQNFERLLKVHIIDCNKASLHLGKCLEEFCIKFILKSLLC